MSTNGIDWTDRRPIDTMTFGLEAPEAERAGVVERVRAILLACSCTVADDIVKLGCTGVGEAASRGFDKGEQLADVSNAVDVGQFLRIGLAGGGVGLPCFVPPDRYCLIHDTVGGLQDGQQQCHAEFVNAVSRDLTPAEQAKNAMVESARRRDQQGAGDMLTGWKRSEAVKSVKERLEEAQSVAEIEAAAGGPPIMPDKHAASFARAFLSEPPPWKCPEHDKPNWKCRYCAAQAIVEGSLEPGYVTVPRECDAVVFTPNYAISADALVGEIERLNEAGVGKLYVYVRVATYTRKLSRD